jgi:flagellar motor switch protein FliM
VAFVTCELKVGDKTGTMNFCLPYLVLQSIGPQLTDFQWSPSVVSGRGMTEDDVAQLVRNVERAEVEFEVELGRTIVSLRDLIALQVGDLVLFDKLTSLPLTARVNDHEKFKVYAGTNRDKLTVQIVDIIKDEDE